MRIPLERKRVSNGLLLNGVTNGLLPSPIDFELWTPEFLDKDLWFDAADESTITESLGKVSQLDDKSGNDYHATQGVVARQPSTGVDTINGLNALTSDGIDDALFMNTFVNDLNSPISCVLLGDLTPNTTEKRFFDLKGSFFARKLSTAFDPNQNEGFIRNAAGLEPRARIQGQSGTEIVTMLYDQSDLRISTNGGSYDQESRPGPLVEIPTAYAIFEQEGVYGEMILRKGLFTETEVQLVQGYLAWKWGAQDKLPPDHPFKNAPPRALPGFSSGFDAGFGN